MYKDKYQREKKKHEALKAKYRERAEKQLKQRKQFQKEIKAFRSSAEEVLNELIKRWAIDFLKEYGYECNKK
jgi:phage-related minor tail protein